MPARALAQTIAAKQRTSTIFNDGAPARRPSACGADQQTQNFVKNLRAHTPRSPSVGRSSSSLASQPRERSQRHYMKATSSSRRRSRNAGLGDDVLGGGFPHQIAPSNYSPSSRLRSQSPCRSAIPPVASTATHVPTRAATMRQGPPLPRSRAPSVPRGLQLQQPPSTLSNGGLRQHGKCFAGISTYSSQLDSVHSSLLPRPRQQQKPQDPLQTNQGSLGSSWTVRDPLTSAGNAHADLVDIDDQPLQLDASDQRELAQLTASIERAALLCCSTETSNERTLASNASPYCTGSTAAPPRSSIESLSHFSGIPKGHDHSLTTVKRHQHIKGSTSTSQSAGRQQQEQPQQLEPLQQQNQQQQQQVMPRSWPFPPQPQEPSCGFNRGMERLEDISSGPRGGRRPGVAPSSFGIPEATPGHRVYCEGLRRLMGTMKFCLRFVVLLIVCLFRLLNTSYDSWSAANFRKAFEEILAGPANGGGNADTSKLQDLLKRISVGCTARSQQQQQQEQQQQHQPYQQQQCQPPYSSRNSANARSSLGSLQQYESNIGKNTPKRGFNFLSSGKKAEGEVLGLHRPALKALCLVVVVVSLLCWLFITTAPKEEFVDFDLM